MLNNREAIKQMLTPYTQGELEKKKEKVWFPEENFAEKMKGIKERLEECYEKGELSRESDLGKVIGEISAHLGTEKPVKKIENLSLVEMETLKNNREVSGLAFCYDSEVIKAAAEILERKLH